MEDLLEIPNDILQSRQAELRALNQYGGSAQVMYYMGRQVPYSTPGATRPDIVRIINGHPEAIEVKYYDLENPGSVNLLLNVLEKQVKARIQHLPKEATQRLVLDVTGRNFNANTVNNTKEMIWDRLKVIYPNIPIDIMGCNMVITSSDYAMQVEVGTGDILYSLYSTVQVRLPQATKDKAPLAIDFLKNGRCRSEKALDTAREINLLRDALSSVPPQDAVYDMNNPEKKAPWAGNISPVVTSCANLYTTADGKDLLFEIVSLLTYAFYAKMSVGVDG